MSNITRSKPPDLAELRREVDAHPLWYHTLDLAPGVVTPGWFDLRPIVDAMPWPDVTGKRCLDIGTYDGFLAFELERRGAAEVIATDIDDPSGWDLAADRRDRRQAAIASLAGERAGRGFAIAKRALGSSVERVKANVYELSPELLGRFDVVVCGSLLLHLRDPLRALERVHSVCGERFLSAETIRIGLGLVHRRRPVAELRGGANGQWWVPSAAGHQTMLKSAGFAIEESAGPYAIPFGAGHPDSGKHRLRRGFTRLLAGNPGVPHLAVLVRPV